MTTRAPPSQRKGHRRWCKHRLRLLRAGRALSAFPHTMDGLTGCESHASSPEGDRSAVLSECAMPHIPAHDTISGFDSGPRDTSNDIAITNLSITVTGISTIWFYASNATEAPRSLMPMSAARRKSMGSRL
ncbi:hypothetical protein BD309DRAFT_647085 [Dichomitus squalens]|nr:hypothetical protein BD309DRAFT_647085 [Dichomitus squalens]